MDTALTTEYGITKRQIFSDKFIRVPGLPSPEAAYPNKKAILSTFRSTVRTVLIHCKFHFHFSFRYFTLRAPFGYGTLIAKTRNERSVRTDHGWGNAKLRIVISNV